MIQKILLLGLCCAFFSLSTKAQVNPPCPTPPPPGAENCQASCVYCDFDGYMGINNGTPSGGNTVCNAIAIHNDQWFGFTAGSTSIEITILTSNCQDGNGLQAAFFDDCSDADAITCNPGSGGGGGQPLVLFYDNFTPGETYFLMIDGWTGDICDFEIDITQGSITPAGPDNALQPQGPTMVCPGATAVYTIPDVANAGNYIWTAPPGSSINGMGASLNVDAPEGTTVTITFGNASGNVCVQADNACNPASPQICLPVVNQPIPPTVKPPITICYEDAPYTWDEDPFPILSVPGTFTLTSTPYDSYLGCDSLVRQTIIIKQIPPTPMGTRYICAGECFELAGDSYCDPGNYNVVFDSYQDCDSLVNFALVIHDPQANIQPPANPIDCNSSGVVLQSTGSTPLGQATYSWQNANWTPVGGASTYNATQTGTYYLVVTVQGGGVICRDTAVVTVTGNTIAPGASATGGNINCLSPQANLTGNSPTGGVTYSWAGPGINAGNQFQQNPTVGQPGVYVLTVQNPTNGCTSSASVTVLGDITPPSANAVGDTITCFQPNVTIDGITNAITPTWNWAGPGINAGNQTLENPNVLVDGTYSVTVTNTANGCTNTATTVVTINNSPPSATAGPNQTLTCASPNTTLQGAGNAGGQPITFSWTGPNGFVSSVAQPSVNVAGTYILTVLNTLSGCSRNDTVVVSANQTPPLANAGADSTITCAQPEVTLVSTGSSNGANFTATWSGPGINAGNSNLYNPTVDQPGDYTLLITNITNGCTATDLVVVDINTALPTATAGTDQQLTCTNPGGVTLSGNGTPATVTYLWTGPGIGANNENLPNPVVTQPGTYDLLVTNPINGCTATDQAIVTQDANVPTADAGPDRTLNCTVTIVDLDGTGSTAGSGIEYTWSGPGINAGNINLQTPTGLNAPGTYNLTVTNTNNSCVNTDVVVIEIDTVSPAANAGNPLILNCFNNTTDTLDASASSSGSIYSLLWSGPGITPANQNSVNPIINNQPGTYFLTVTNTNNTCTATAQVDVTLDIDAPIADAGADQTIDCVVLSTTIGGNSSSGANFTYLWTGPGIDSTIQASATPLVDVSGTYTLVVTNTINGCTTSDDIVVNTDAVYPTALAGNDGLLTCANTNATLDGSASSAGPNFSVLWSGPGINAGNQNQVSPVVTVPGTYVIEITNTTNSCITRDTVVVDENVAVPNASAGLDQELNCQTTSTTLDGSLSSVSPTIVYLWTGAGINASNQNDQNPPVDQPDTYDLLVTDTENGCTSTDQVVITQDIALPNASAGADGLLTCDITTQLLDGSGSSTGAVFAYVWEGPGINSNNFNAQSPTVDESGTYTVTVTNTQNFCTATDIVFVDEDVDLPIIAAGPDRTITCAADTVQLDASLSASGPNISFAWTGPGIVPGDEITSTPLVITPGVYLLTITDANNGCTNVDAVTVDEDVLTPVANANTDLVITCANSGTGVALSAAGSDSGTGFSLLWTGPGITPANETSPNPTVLTTGTYTLLITNTQNGCTETDEVVVAADQNLPTASAGPDQVITCAFTDAVLDGTGSNTPNGTLTFTWVGPGINAGNANGDMPTVLVPGLYTLTVENPVTGCSASDQVEVTLDNQAPTVAATSELITCADPVSTVSVNSSANSSSYHWEGPDVNQNNNDNQTLQVDVAGLYAVTVTDNNNGCTAVTSTIVEEDEDVPQGAAEGGVLNCNNDGTTFISGEVISPAGSTFVWTGPGIGNATTNTVTVTQPGTYTFTISAPNGCVRPFEVEVISDFVQPDVTAAATAQIDCNTSEVTINAGGTSVGPNYSYYWTTDNGNIVSGANTLLPTVNRAGDYQLLVLNNLNGCSDSITVEVEVDPAVPSGFNVEVRDIKCFGDTNGSITVNGIQGGTPPFIFSLSGNTGSANNQYTGLSAGDYVLAVEDANGCSLDTMISISEPGELTVDLGPDVEVSLGESATVAAQIVGTTGISSVEWNYAPGCDSLATFCETFTYQPFDSYRHRITVADSNGCVARDEVLVIVKKNRQVYVPNIFTPDGDLNFSVGVFVGIDVAKINYFNIFDRWGEQVYQLGPYVPTPGAAPDANQSWDGRMRGDKAHNGVYVWYCEVEFIDGEVKLFKGDITLIR